MCLEFLDVVNMRTSFPSFVALIVSPFCIFTPTRIHQNLISKFDSYSCFKILATTGLHIVIVKRMRENEAYFSLCWIQNMASRDLALPQFLGNSCPRPIPSFSHFPCMCWLKLLTAVRTLLKWNMETVYLFCCYFAVIWRVTGGLLWYVTSTIRKIFWYSILRSRDCVMCTW
jgi:hypothetical protein